MPDKIRRAFVRTKFTDSVVINMTNFDTPTVDTILSRFPSIAQNIFKELDKKKPDKV